ncbi:MAG: hypothetical protein IH946_07225, partial [Bacteroidetes bacterium]|nr:hypothetical protein [Bacteroidota bacterium]
QGFDAIYRYNFPKADSIIKHMRDKHGEEVQTYFLSTNYYWWLLVTGKDIPSTRERFYDNLEVMLTILDSNTMNREPNNDEIYNYVIVYGFKARLEVLHRKYFKAIRYLDDCIDYIKRSFNKEDEYPFFYLTSGLYNFNMHYTIKNYPFLIFANWFYPKGDREKGLEQLAYSASHEDPILWTEGNYFSGRIYLELEKDFDKAKIHIENLLHRYPQNPFYRYMNFQNYLWEGQGDNAKDQLMIMRVYMEENKRLEEWQKAYFLDLAVDELKEHRNKEIKNNQ